MSVQAKVRSDQVFNGLLRFSAITAVGLMVGLVAVLVLYSRESITKFGVGFLVETDWDPVRQNFGALPYIFGTVVTSAIALVLSFPPAVSAAIFVVHYAPRRIGNVVAVFIELLAAIPSVVFGIWGIFVLVPFMRGTVDPFLQSTLGNIPILGALFPPGSSFGQNLLTAGTILSFMIIPTIMSVSRGVIAQAPKDEINSYRALGATRWEVVRDIVWPHSYRGILAAVMLALARALGETMAVTMVVGNSFREISPSLFNPGYTLASGIANQFTEADSPLYFSAIVELGLVLLLVDSVISIIAHAMTRRNAK